MLLPFKLVLWVSTLLVGTVLLLPVLIGVWLERKRWMEAD